METLLDSLEVLLDAEANPEYEVEYSVRLPATWQYFYLMPLIRAVY